MKKMTKDAYQEKRNKVLELKQTMKPKAIASELGIGITSVYNILAPQRVKRRSQVIRDSVGKKGFFNEHERENWLI